MRFYFTLKPYDGGDAVDKGNGEGKNQTAALMAWAESNGVTVYSVHRLAFCKGGLPRPCIPTPEGWLFAYKGHNLPTKGLRL